MKKIHQADNRAWRESFGDDAENPAEKRKHN
jgi:hypothetical protein